MQFIDFFLFQTKDSNFHHNSQHTKCLETTPTKHRWLRAMPVSELSIKANFDISFNRVIGSEMKTLFSARTRSSTWRQLWVWLAEAERELGLPISEEAIEQMKANVKFTDNDFVVVAEEEKK